MRTESLDVMHSKPGIWTVIGPFGVLFVETDDDGRSWQLDPNDEFKRDGELHSGGWNLHAISHIVGPLARP